MLDLSREQQHLAHTIMRNRFPGRQTRVFGSRARGIAKPWSDLDLVILGQEPVSDLAMAEARADFEESDLPFRVDLAVWKDLPHTLQKQIEQHGKPL